MDTTFLLTVGVCLVVIYLLQRWFSRSDLPPGPFGYPILGYLPFLSRHPYLDFNRLAKKYGSIFSLQLGSTYMVVLNDFKLTKEAFAKDAFFGRPKESPFNLSEETLRTEAFNGLPWMGQRRFSLHMLRDLGFGRTKMEGHIQEEISELIELMGEHLDRPFCLTKLLAPSMSNNISSLVFGKRYKYNDPERIMMTRVLFDTTAAAGQATWQLFFPTVKKIFQALGIGDIEKIDRIQKELRDFTKRQIDEHEATLDPNNVRDYIDGYLLEIKKRKDDPSFCKGVLVDMVGAFFGAGSETVRLAIDWLLLTAAEHPDAQRRIQKEIDEVLGREQYPTWNHQKSMPYTEAFIKELMRWRTIVPINVVRSALTTDEIGGYRIPKDTQIMANLWAIHHDPEYWGEDAEEFKPERFLTEDGQVKKWDRFVPFSIGKRACPGEILAKIEIFLYFVSILQKFNVAVPEGDVLDFEGELGIGLSPKSQELVFTQRP